MVIWADNQGTIALANVPESHKRTKHIDTELRWVREVIEQGILLLEFLPTRVMAADDFNEPPTKAISAFPWDDWYVLTMGELEWRSGKAEK